MSETNIDKFKRLLSELFMFDYADLDFGIYRIMNAKRDEIRRFLDDDLLPQVRQEIEHLGSSKREEWKADLEAAIATAKRFGADPETSDPVLEIRRKLEQTIDVTALENDIFSDLYDFFRRYYSEGDYLSLRRYKEGVYAIPYEGEEVKLHWANADQYYIKTSEYFRDYTFKLRDNRRVHFKLTSADTEQNNNKASNGEKRVFILCDEDFIAEEDGELVIRFEYRVDPEKRSQSDLNQEAAERILNAPNLQTWMMVLGRPAPTDANPDRTLLHKYLADYTSRNTFDYFIHKDLGAFLCRELDFFIKNEIMHLDDIEHASALRADSYLAKIKALRRVAKKVIDFLEQLENFQKKLWLKKKFVIETHYCVTLDRVPEELYPEIAANDVQREEWVRLFAIDEINGDLIEKRYSMPLSVEFLQQNQYLLVDTRFFDDNFKYRLLSSFGDLDTAIDGTLINSENFQALELLAGKFREDVQCIYIDPPYNTSMSEIIYKNGYKHSSWLSLLNDRLTSSLQMMHHDSIICVAIDDSEFHRLYRLMLELLGEDNILGSVVVRSNPSGRSTAKGFSIAHDYLIFGALGDDAAIGRLPRSEKQLQRYKESDEIGPYEWVNFRKHGGASASRSARMKMFYPIYCSENGIRIPEMVWDDRNEEWLTTEEPLPEETVVLPINAAGEEKRWKWGHESVKTNLDNFQCRLDQTGTLGVYMKSRMNLEGMLPLSLWDKKEYSATEYGTNYLTDMLGDNSLFSFPKSINAVIDSLRVGRLGEADLCLDYFAGSGTTGEAVIQLNREDDGDRKYILIEMGDYFETALKPRILKSVYSTSWNKGKPKSRDGISHLVKYIKLESFEDTLNNLRWNRTPQQQKLLWDEGKDEFREDYMLRYMLDVEAKGSASLLDLTQFVNPFAYQLEIGTETVGETRPVTIDLVETFNYLLGLHVRRVQAFDHIRTVEGENRDGQQVLIIWRNQDEIDNEALDAFFLGVQVGTGRWEVDDLQAVSLLKQGCDLPKMPGGTIQQE